MSSSCATATVHVRHCSRVSAAAFFSSARQTSTICCVLASAFDCPQGRFFWDRVRRLCIRARTNALTRQGALKRKNSPFPSVRLAFTVGATGSCPRQAPSISDPSRRLAVGVPGGAGGVDGLPSTHTSAFPLPFRQRRREENMSLESFPDPMDWNGL